MTPFIKYDIYNWETDGIHKFKWSKSSFCGEFVNHSKKFVRMYIGSPSNRVLKLTYEDGVEVNIVVKEGWDYYIFEHKNNKISFEIEKLIVPEDLRDLGIMISTIEYTTEDIVYKNLLLVGSAWYVKEWWHENISKFKFDEIYAINNSFLVTQDYTDVWYIASDFLCNNNFNLQKFLSDSVYYRYSKITSRFLEKPFWYTPSKNGHGTMILNVLYDILNNKIIDDKKCKLHIIGCDLNYSNQNSHFYGIGTPDPLRLGEEYLIRELNNVNNLYLEHGHKIINLSKENGLLPFEKHNLI